MRSLKVLTALAVLALPLFAASASFEPASSHASGDPVIAAAGDIACDPIDKPYNEGQGTAKACRQVFTSSILTGAGLAAVLPLGDDQYECSGFLAYQQAYDQTWGQLKSITDPVTGNHEYFTSGGTDCDTSGTAAGYFRYFGSAAGDPSKGYYSFDIGTWHLIALNSNCPQVGGCSNGSAQDEWLKADLAAHPTSCTLAYFHYPRFSSSGNVKGPATFWSDLYAAGADVVLSAHKHNYERFAPQDPHGRCRSRSRHPRVRRRHRGQEPPGVSYGRTQQRGARRRHVRRPRADAASGQLQLAVRAGGGKVVLRLRHHVLSLSHAPLHARVPTGQLFTTDD